MSGETVAYLSKIIGASESATRLLLSLFAGYPLALIYRSAFIYYLPAAAKHILFALSGLLLIYYNYGWDVYHSLFNIVVIYIVLKVAGGTRFSVAFAFLFNIMYIFIGYYVERQYQEENAYSVSWTTPHCVLTMRLTAVAFDLYDGQKRPVPAEAKDSALSESPGLLELLGQSYFFGGVLVGPQFCMQRYLRFVNGEYSNSRTGGPPNSKHAALQRLLMGLVYIGVYQAVYTFIPDDYLLTPTFQEKGLLVKCLLLIVWGKNCLNKFLGVWLITEGVMILCGLSYNGLDKNNVPRWDACTNVQIILYETGCTMQDIVNSYNYNTNLWLAKYVFKRLRFLGSKDVSQLAAMLYLAIWHGIELGYYFGFFMEFIYVTCERQSFDAISRVAALRKVTSVPVLKPVTYMARKTFTLFCISAGMLAFSLHHWAKWSKVYAATSYIHFTVPLVVLLVCLVVRQVFPPHKISENGKVQTGRSKTQESTKTE